MIEDCELFQLAGIYVDPKKDQLSCGDRVLTVQSMAMKVLCFLAVNKDKIISRAQLREEVWKNTTASNQTINNHIYNLRRTLAKLLLIVWYLAKRGFTSLNLMPRH